MADRNVYALNQAGRGSEAGARKVFGVVLATVNTTDLALNRTLGLCVAPAGFIVTGHTTIVTDMDTGTAAVFTIGDAGSTNRLVTVATTMQAGGTLTTLASTGLYYRFPADTEVFLTMTTAAGTAVAGTITFQLEGYMS